MVRGVRDGSVDETALRRLVNEAFGEPKAPIIYEVQLSFYDAPLVDDNANEQEHKKALPLWKWMDSRPLSTLHHYPLSNDLKDAYLKSIILIPLSSSSTTNPTENVTDTPFKASSSWIEIRIDPALSSFAKTLSARATGGTGSVSGHGLSLSQPNWAADNFCTRRATTLQ